MRVEGLGFRVDVIGNCAPRTRWTPPRKWSAFAEQRVWTPLNATSPRRRHALYAASLIAGHAPAAESQRPPALVIQGESRQPVILSWDQGYKKNWRNTFSSSTCS